MTAVIHRTPGLLDIRSLTVMGLSAKPRSDNPIGMFGTGLKYAIATLCRLGCSPIVWIGRDKYTFVGRKEEFRGAGFTQIRAKLEKPSLTKPKYIALPYTTEYGKFWKPWQAFREIESNTRDEGGETYEVGAADTSFKNFGGNSECTYVIVDLPAYVEAHRLKHEIFLRDGWRAPPVDSPSVQILPDEGRFVYWRGLRVYDPPKPTTMTYNFVRHLELTEDRTLKYGFMAKHYLAVHLMLREHDEDVIEKALCAGSNYWEHKLDFSQVGVEPTTLFKATAKRCLPRAPYMGGLVTRWEPRPAGQTPMERHPRPWHVDGDDLRIVDALGCAVFAPPPEQPTDWLELAREVVKRVNGQQSPSEDIIRDGEDEVDAAC